MRGSKNYHNTYRKLKLKILFNTIITTTITGILFSVIVYFIAQNTRIRINYYIVTILLLVLLIFIFYRVLTSMTKYIDNLVDSVDNVIKADSNEVELMDELKPLEDKLNELRLNLIEREESQKIAEEKKSNLLLYLAHDIKTPLTTIIAHLQLLKTNPHIKEENRIKYIDIAYEKAMRLNTLLNEFFDIAKYSLKEIELEKDKFNLSLMLEQIADELHNVLKNKNLDIELKADEELIVYGDINRIARVFDNLLKNAISYSRPNSRIEITAREVGIWIEVTFTNYGDNIPEKDLEMIFDNFYRGDNSRSSSTGGSGLGLAISKQIVELHDGKIEAFSSNNTTRFVVVLPEVTEEERREKDKRQKERIEDAIKYDKINIGG